MDLGEIFGKIKKSKYSWIVYILFTIPINLLLILAGGCLSFLMIALVTFGIPYLFGVKSTKTFLKAGIFIILVTGMLFGVIYTNFRFNQEYYFEEIHLEDGQLKDGIVTPYKGDLNTSFNYSVRYTGSEALNNITVYVNITDLGDYEEGIPLKNDGRLFYNETKLNKSKYYYYYFSAYLHNEDKWIRTRQPRAGVEVFGPLVMSYNDVLFIEIVQNVIYLFLDSGIFFLMIVVFYYWRKTAQRQQKEWEEKMKAEEEEIKKEKEKEEKPKEKVIEFECTSCGAVVEADAEKCPKCGEDFEGEEEPKKEKVIEFECTSCGAVVEADAEKCPKCGEDFEDEEEK